MLKVPEEYKSLYTSPKPIQLITGGRGSAKSFNVALFFVRLTYEKNHTILYTRYTMTSAQISIIPEFLEKMQMEGLESDFRITQNSVINKLTGSKTLFRGILANGKNQTANLKSIKGLSDFVVDEAEEWVDERSYQTIQDSVRKKGVRNRIVIVMNNTDRNHFIYKRLIKDTKKIIQIEGYDVEISTHPDVNHIHTYYGNYKEYLSDFFIQNAERMKERDKVRYGEIYIGQWRNPEGGMMYPNGLVEYDYDIDLTKSINYSFTDVSGGGDYFCTWFIALYKDKFHVFDCIYKQSDSTVTKPLLAEKAKIYHCSQNIIETNKDGEVFVNDYNMAGIPAMGIFNTQSKLSRIEAFADRIDLFLFKKNGSEEFEKAKEHLRDYPRTGYRTSQEGYDDAPDALSMAQHFFYVNYNFLFR